ncbi:MAG: cytochrome c3 family protein [Desulfuromonadales bacterium]
MNQQCLTCHQQSAKPWGIGFPKVKSQELCFKCHTSKSSWFSREVIHGPLHLGGCTLCHNPHGENHRYQLWAEGSLALCITCHGDKQNLVSKKDRVPYVHGILLGEGCVACHNPHASDQEFMLHKPINTLCLGCHSRQSKFSSGHPVPRHPVAGSAEHLRPGRELSCSSCHNPHGSSHKYMLIESIQGGRLCRVCHEK